MSNLYIQITPTTELVRKRRDVDNNTLAINITGNCHTGLMCMYPLQVVYTKLKILLYKPLASIICDHSK